MIQLVPLFTRLGVCCPFIARNSIQLARANESLTKFAALHQSAKVLPVSASGKEMGSTILHKSYFLGNKALGCHQLFSLSGTRQNVYRETRCRNAITHAIAEVAENVKEDDSSGLAGQQTSLFENQKPGRGKQIGLPREKPVVEKVQKRAYGAPIRLRKAPEMQVRDTPWIEAANAKRRQRSRAENASTSGESRAGSASFLERNVAKEQLEPARDNLSSLRWSQEPVKSESNGRMQQAKEASGDSRAENASISEGRVAQRTGQELLNAGGVLSVPKRPQKFQRAVEAENNGRLQQGLEESRAGNASMSEESVFEKLTERTEEQVFNMEPAESQKGLAYESNGGVQPRLQQGEGVQRPQKESAPPLDSAESKASGTENKPVPSPRINPPSQPLSRVTESESNGFAKPQRVLATRSGGAQANSGSFGSPKVDLAAKPYPKPLFKLPPKASRNHATSFFQQGPETSLKQQDPGEVAFEEIDTWGQLDMSFSDAFGGEYPETPATSSLEFAPGEDLTAEVSTTLDSLAAEPVLKRKPPAMRRPQKGKAAVGKQKASAGKSSSQRESEVVESSGTSKEKSAAPLLSGFTLEGIVRRIVYENGDNGYVIARMKATNDVPGLELSQGKKQSRPRWKNKGGKDAEDLVTVVGTLPKIAEGQQLKLVGGWRENAKFGREFVATGCEEMEVSSLPDLVIYLGGGILPKVGPVRAAAMVEIFGDQTLTMLDSDEATKKLRQVPGIGRSTASEIKAAWEERRGVRKAMNFLQQHGVPSAAAQRIVRKHEERTESEVLADPWEATSGVHGFGFEKAEALARSIGTSPTLIGRRTAGIRSVLTGVCGSEGHAFLPWKMVRQQTEELLAQTGGLTQKEKESGWGKLVDREGLEQGLMRLVRNEKFSKKVIVEERDAAGQEEKENGWISDDARCYLPVLHAAEVSLAENVAARLHFSPPGSERPINEADLDENLSEDQRRAVHEASSAPMLVLTGGPGTGKTYTLRTIVKLWKSMGKTVQCCAPTGRASQRLAESVEMDAKTIHRLLEYKPGENFWGSKDSSEDEVATISQHLFSRNAQNHLECNALVVDEASMLDLPLADALFSAMPPHAQILLVGDIDQLPPVGPGNVLRDLINSGKVPVVRLTEVFRQAQKSAIVTNAHAINQGQFPDLEITHATPKQSGRGSSPGGSSPSKSAQKAHFGAASLEDNERDGVMAVQSSIVKSDCLWVNVPDHKVSAALQEVISPGGLLSQLRIDPRKDVQVLSPIRRGATGTSSFNSTIQGLLNPATEVKGHIEYRQTIFRVGDRVIQTSNDYERAVFNGDLGTITHVDTREKQVTVRFQNRAAGTEATVMYGPQMSGPLACLEDLSLAWAVTVHKSQGSEYPVVLLPVSKWHHKLLSRKLIYTGLTRARKLAVVIGPRGPIETAVATITDDDRYTFLRQRLGAMTDLRA